VTVYCIDYRNGGMGNTILAHVLFSCCKANLDLENFFSDTGHSHKISLFKKRDLTAQHLIEFPDPEVNCILQMQSNDWFLLLQYKMSYVKWHRESPNLDNWGKFFKNEIKFDNKKIWQDFYANVKDQTWPECESYEDVTTLPGQIQAEINSLYRIPNTTIETDLELLEFLTVCYFELLSKDYSPRFAAPVYQLEDYFAYKIDPLISIADRLHWTWDEDLSKKFFSKILEINAVYLQWLDTMKYYHNQTVAGIECPIKLDVWEWALLIAKICQTLSYDPKNIKWQDSGCVLWHDNVTLIKLLRG